MADPKKAIFVDGGNGKPDRPRKMKWNTAKIWRGAIAASSWT